MTEHIHISDIRAFSSCRRKFYYSSARGLYLTPTEQQQALSDGTLFHVIFELVHRDGIPPTKELFWAACRKLFSDIEDEELFTNAMMGSKNIQKVIAGYFEHFAAYRGHWSNDKFEFLHLEREFEQELTPELLTICKQYKIEPFNFAGRIDGIVRRKDDGSIWLWENKTSGNPQSLKDSLWNDNQSGLYLWVAQQMYALPVKGIVYNIVKKTPPKDPEILKSGKVSQNKSCSTTLGHYWNFLRNQFPTENPDTLKDEYREMLSYLANNKNEFYERVDIVKSPAVISNQMKWLTVKACEMLQPNVPYYPIENPFSCGFCSFKYACSLRNEGRLNDEEVYLKSKFVERKPYEPLEI